MKSNEQSLQQLSVGKKILAAVILLFVAPLAIIVGLELAARIFWSGQPTKLFLQGERQDLPDVYRANYLAARRFFPGNLARKPLPEIFLQDKPENLKRIFVLGESAARGEQLADFSFARMLETFMNQGHKERVVEVINTGIPAINSWVFNEFAHEIVNYSPDLIVIYGGHNEFIGPYGPSTVFSFARSRAAALAGIQASKLRLIQALASDKIPDELKTGWQGLEMFKNNRIDPDNPAIDSCLQNWLLNLESIFKTANHKNIPVIFCTAASNEKDFPPFMSIEVKSRKDTADLKKFKELIEEQKYTESLPLAEQLHSTYGKHALINFLYGTALLNLGQHDKATQFLKNARNLDSFRVRTTDEFNDKAVELAKTHGIIVADAKAEMAAVSSDGLIGRDMIYDHVHLTEAGHHSVTSSILAKIALLDSFNDIMADKDELPELFDLLRLMGYGSNDKAMNLEHIRASMALAPFTMLFGHEELINKLTNEAAMAQKQISTITDTALAIEALGSQPQSWAINLRLGLLQTINGNSTAARAFFLRSLALNPYNIDAWNNLGILQMSTGQINEAEQSYCTALKLAPDFSRAFFNLGLCAAEKNNESEAEQYYGSAVNADPANSAAWRNLANLHFRKKDYQKAAAGYEQAFKADPTDVNAKIGLANSLSELKQVKQAIAIYLEACESWPDLSVTHYSLGNAYENANQPDKAIKAFGKSIELGHKKSAQRAAMLILSNQSKENLAEHIKILSMACEITEFHDPWLLQVLANLYTNNDQYDSAIETLTKAEQLALRQGDNNLVNEIRQNLNILKQL